MTARSSARAPASVARTALGLAAAACVSIALVACGNNAVAAGCSDNIAVVDSSPITTIQYDALLRYTLGFYEHGNSNLRYYGKDICGAPRLDAVCSSIKRNLVKRMIDQQVVSDYAAAHNLIATAADWVSALRREHQLVKAAGGQDAFLAYLQKVHTDQAEFRFLESQQIETRKVRRAIGGSKFHRWLAHQEAAANVVTCTTPS